ncbi:MAG: hypothetical protein BWK80_51975 [Desulfobacteraceae bacterium IS3]|nr:MAG: hypothetical protein BWK80_51975 [Desulfobacteraceae bacterium IS3]
MIQGEIRKNIAVGVTITSLIFAVPIYIPLLSVLCPLFIPLPILFYRLKLGRKSGAFVPILSAAVMMTLAGGLSPGIAIFAELMLAGFLLGELSETKLSVEKTVMYVWIAVLLTGGLGLTVYGQISGNGIHTFLSDITKVFDDILTSLKEDREISAEKILVISEFIRQTREVFLIIKPVLPGMAASSILFVIWANLLMAGPILRNRGLTYPDFGPLNLWKVPEFMVWGVIGCGFMLILPDRFLKISGLNGLIILMTVYFFGGIAVISFYFEKKRFSLALRIFLYGLIALQVTFQFLVIALGFFDLWLDFRKIKSET